MKRKSVYIKVQFPGECMWVIKKTKNSGVLDNNSFLNKRLKVGTPVTFKKHNARLIGRLKRK